MKCPTRFESNEIDSIDGNRLRRKENSFNVCSMELYVMELRTAIDWLV